MKTNKNTIAVLVAAMMAASAWASDVYIDQIGDDTQINITQTQGMNTVNTDGAPAVVNGDGIRINLVQQGDLNTADINLRTGSDGTLLDYSAVGSFNDLTVDLATAIDNKIDVTVNGDNNTVSVCGNLACTASASVNDTINVVNVDGSYNSVRFALGASSSVNTVSITGGGVGTGNTVDIVQTNGVGHVSNVAIAGGTNTVLITQGQ